MTPYDAVLFLSFGGPEKSEDIMPFLEIVTRGRGIPKARLAEVAHHYELMGGASPINEITRRQAQALQKELATAGCDLPVFVGQRNWHPFVEDTLRQMVLTGVKKPVAFITAAHRCEASLERYVEAVDQAREKVPGAPLIDYVSPWFDHPLFIGAVTARIEEILCQSVSQRADLMNAPWYFIAHSIPCAMAKESTYVTELKKTAELVCAQLGKSDWKMAYSSRSGNPQDPWLIPDVCDVIRAEAARGAKDIFFVTIGFLADHVEVLFDQDVEARQTAAQVGIRFHRSATVGEHPLFVKMMAEVIRERAQGSVFNEQSHSGSTLYNDGRRENKMGRASGSCYCFPDRSAPPCCQSVSPSMSRAAAPVIR